MLHRRKKLGTLAAALAMVMAAAGGCGNGEASEGKSPASEAGESNVSAQAESTEEALKNINAGDEDLSEITVAFYNTIVPTKDNISRIEDAINDITIPEIHTKVTLNIISMGQWDQQINLMLSSGEKLDLMPTFFAGSTAFNTMSGTNQLAPLNDLLDEYGQGILETVPKDYLETTSFDNKIYAVPIYRDVVGYLYYAMRTDILEELGLTEQAENISSMQDIEELLKIVKEKTDLVPICETAASGILAFQYVMVSGDFEDAFFYDRLLNEYIVSSNEEPEHVTSLYDLEEYKECITLFEKWFNEGLVNKDAATAEEHAEYHIAAGNTFSTFYSAETSTANAFRTKAEYPVTIIEVCEVPMTTGNVNTLNWVIPVTSQEPEAAMKFMNMMYTDERIVNLLNYGQKDVDYIIKADGTLTFPDGKDIGSVGYHFETSWLFGNQFLASVWEGDSADLRERALEINQNAKRSPIFGFTGSGNGMDTQLAGILSACNEYANGLQCGVMDVEENFPQFKDKLKAAGIDDVVISVQEQLDGWLADKEGEK